MVETTSLAHNDGAAGEQKSAKKWDGFIAEKIDLTAISVQPEHTDEHNNCRIQHFR